MKKALEAVKSSYKSRMEIIVIFKMGHITSQNGPFCATK